jgi:hypothetical protein
LNDLYSILYPEKSSIHMPNRQSLQKIGLIISKQEKEQLIALKHKFISSLVSTVLFFALDDCLRLKPSSSCSFFFSFLSFSFSSSSSPSF